VNAIEDIPCFPTSAFKDYDVTSLSPAARTGRFLSSGTTSERSSQHYHDTLSLKIYKASLLSWFETRVLSQVGHAGRQMISLTPTKEQAPHSSLVFMFEAFRRFFENPVFLGEADASGSWNLNYPAVFQCLETCEDRPIFLMGTAFLYVLLLDWMEQNGLSLQLPKGSMVLETGGYKGRVRHVPKIVLYEKIQKHFGIDRSAIVCEYGMCELSSQAYDGEILPAPTPSHIERPLELSRCFQFPPWARVQIVSPETGKEVPLGETGLIRIFDLANIRSVMAIQTEDLGIRCAEGFNFLGRFAGAEPRGCSRMAAD
jgi:hypothetical protein